MLTLYHRAGKKEREIEDAKFEKGTAELMAYRAQMAAGQYARQGPQPQRF